MDRNNGLERKVIKIIENIGGKSVKGKVRLESDLEGMGFDSISYLRILIALENTFDVHIIDQIEDVDLNEIKVSAQQQGTFNHKKQHGIILSNGL